jgi:hypothetical protein
MTPREIIGQWLQSAPWVHDPFGPWTEVADDLLKALDEQGMAVVPKAGDQLLEEIIKGHPAPQPW